MQPSGCGSLLVSAAAAYDIGVKVDSNIGVPMQQQWPYAPGPPGGEN